MRTSRVLFIANSDDLHEGSLAEALAPFDIELHHAADVQAARQWMQEFGVPHLLLVDLSQAEGMEFVEELTETIKLPIVTIAGSEGTTEEALQALQHTDDFIRRQFAAAPEVALRIRRVLARMPNSNYASGPEIKIADWLSIDLVNRQAKVHGEIRKLTRTESALLSVLLTHRGSAVDASTFLERVWRLDPSVKDLNALRVHVHRLRNKLGDDHDSPGLIMTARGIGYSFAEAPAETE